MRPRSTAEASGMRNDSVRESDFLHVMQAGHDAVAVLYTAKLASALGRKAGLSAAVTAGVTLLMLPVHFFLVFLTFVALSTNDASGQGGPFKSCTAESVECTSPIY